MDLIGREARSERSGCSERASKKLENSASLGSPALVSLLDTVEEALTVDGIAAGVADQADFETLVRRHQGMVFGLAYNFLGDSGLAEDVAQDVFLSLYNNLKKLKSGEHVVWCSGG